MTVLDPARTVVEPGVEVGPETVLHPGVSLLGASRVGAGCTLHTGAWLRDSRLADGVVVEPYSALDGARVEAGARVGPFARLRPGAELAAGARVGNFVEVKNARLGEGAKANHLAYLGDATVGAGANVGAGVVTCNYDGRDKHRTDGRPRCLRRQRHDAGGPGLRGRRRHHRRRLGDHPRRARRGARGGPGPAAQRPRLERAPAPRARARRAGRDGRGVTACAGSSDTWETRRWCRCCSTGCGASSTAATTRRASWWSTTAHLETVRAEGKLDRLVEKLDGRPLAGSHGLGHTRWATHGAPSERNAHPMVDARQRVALIHNGIIENFLPLKRRLADAGWTFRSDTDTEVIANLVSSHLDGGGDLVAAVRATCAELEGMYAFAVVRADGDGDREIVAARQGPPLILGLGDGEQYLASDPAALIAHTRDVIFLENGDIARVTPRAVEILDAAGEPVERRRRRLDWDPVQADKGGYRHYMLKEIHEQTQAVQDTFAGRVDFTTGEISFDGFAEIDPALAAAERFHLLACGTSWHAALVGKFLIEELARVPVEVDYGSEYRYRDPIVGERVVALGISQSGETADTLSAMEAARERGARLLALCNVPGSEATRVSDGTLYTHAGPEIGVASTKAFTTQLVALYLLTLYLRQVRGLEPRPELAAALSRLPHALDATLAGEAEIERIARRFFRADDFLYLGRGINYPIALEGALKLKEISYIHAEGYPAGEMKHGPIALIDQEMPVVALATGDLVFEKVKSNMQEVKARDGVVIALTDRDPGEVEEVADEVIRVPRVEAALQPIVNVLPLQLLAYHIGVRRGADVDQPRNLAKSVTVE